ncbi:hypothetical protein [Pseudomonas sp.]|uniref:hypothetical protein n=1 Tax=Pseudomonas sp. TaxID=306 RepID=UPI0038621783
MGQYQRLLLIADQTLHQSPAMLRAVALPKASGAALDVRAFVEPAPIVHVWEEKIDDAGYQRYLRRYRRWVAGEVEQLSGQGLENHSSSWPVGSVCPLIVDLSLTDNPSRS